MPRHVPKYVRHKARNKGKVTINGKTHYLPGEFGSEESRDAYNRLIAEYLSKKNAPETANVTFRFLAVAYLKFCEVFYVDEDGKPSAEVNQVRLALKPLLTRFGRETANSFGPRKLKQIREQMICSGLFRNTINDRVSRIVRMLSWAAAEEYLNPQIVQACRELRNLQEGRCGDLPETDAIVTSWYLPNEARSKMLERVAARISYHQGRNAVARESHTKTRIDRYAALGVDPDKISKCRWPGI